MLSTKIIEIMMMLRYAMRCYVTWRDESNNFAHFARVWRGCCANWRWKRRRLSYARLKMTFRAATQFLFFAVPILLRFFSIRFTQMIERQLKLGDVYTDAGGNGTSIMAWRLFQRLPAGYIIESSFTPAVYHEFLSFFNCRNPASSTGNPPWPFSGIRK